MEDVGFCVQPSLPWLGASPDGLIVYKGSTMEPGLLEIKCPYTKRNWSPNELVADKKLYIARNNADELFLKSEHSSRYYTHIQIAVSLTDLKWCHFVVYVYSGLIRANVNFDQQ